jgi:hypothetical protein
MIDKWSEEAAALYVLGLLEGTELDAFERQLRECDELQRLVRELGAGLYEPVRQLPGAARPELLAGVLDRLAPPQADAMAVAGSPSRRLAGVSRLPWATIWAAAALLFIGLNLALLMVLSRQFGAGQDPQPVAANRSEAGSSAPGALQTAPPEFLAARIQRLEQDLAARESAIVELRRERDQLAEAKREADSSNSGWQREYARLAARILPFFEPNDGMSRFTVIEMVDAEAFEQALPRRGFADLAGRFLAGEGNIAGVRPGEFVGPIVEGAGAASGSLDATRSGLTPVARGDAAAFSGAAADAAASGESQDAVTGSGDARAAGFTVWRDDEQKGFLDLYNLPDAGPDQQRFLWVRSGELDPYIPVGILPDLENGTGSLFYSVDEPNFTPTEILITAEPEAGSGDVPGGRILLRGP